MKGHRHSSGFAVLLVLWTLVTLSIVALTFAASAGTEVRASQDSWNDLQAEQLAKSGHEFSAYIETRALGTPAEDLVGLPIEWLVRGLRYRVTLDDGTVDVILEGENGRLDLASMREEDREAFFASWTGDVVRSQEIAASISDWIDTDEEFRPFGAEAGYYLSRGYRPRNALGVADLFLVKGLTPEDLMPSISISGETPAIRDSLTRVISAIHTGGAVNPNYAPRVVLRSLPGMTPGILSSIIEMRQRSIFNSPLDFRNRTAVPEDSPLLPYLTFDRGMSPAVLTIARLRNSPRVRVEQRTRTADPYRQTRFVSLVERSMPAQ